MERVQTDDEPHWSTEGKHFALECDGQVGQAFCLARGKSDLVFSSHIHCLDLCTNSDNGRSCIDRPRYILVDNLRVDPSAKAKEHRDRREGPKIIRGRMH